tara:strand:+ start:154934 stop:156103 length:1170 start_codon:yes stop_codon:yes gene_type:complete
MPDKKLSNSLLYLMATAAGLVVANNYYNQPLLNLIAKTFEVSESEVSNIPLFSQLGFAFGLLFIIPLGDMFPRKKIILIDIVAVTVALLATAIAPSLFLMTVSSFLVGFASVVPQLFVPMAAQMASDERRGRAIGIVTSGLLIGILGSRFISGFVGEYFGWRFMYYLAAGFMVILGILLKAKLPELYPDFEGSYAKLMKSIGFYFRTESSVRLAALRGGLAFAGFSGFWTTLVFLMEDSFHYGSGVTGMFGLLGIAGASAAALMGKLSDRINKNNLITICGLIMITAWTIFEFSSASLFGIIIGVLLVDMGVQSLHIVNQNIIFSRNPEARNRVNTIYMVGYFIGGALGTTSGAYAWELYKWPGVATMGLIYSILILVVHFIFKKPDDN